MQNQYNLAHRDDDALVDALAARGIAYVPFFPLGGFSPLQSTTLSNVAARLGATPMQVALAWLLHRAPNILLIPGTSSLGPPAREPGGREADTAGRDARRAEPHRGSRFDLGVGPARAVGGARMVLKLLILRRNRWRLHERRREAEWHGLLRSVRYGRPSLRYCELWFDRARLPRALQLSASTPRWPKRLGLDRFENVRLHPVVMTDCAGKRHEFHFRMRLLGSMVALDAFEAKAGTPKGYQFQILGKPDDEPLSLLGRLVERMRRSLSVKYLVRSELGTQIADQTVRGRIEWDESQPGRVPLLVIDGREVSWDEVGRMLISFEGWQFRLEIRDRSEEV